MLFGDSPVPAGYLGQDMPETILSFLKCLLEDPEFSVEESGSARKTLTIYWNVIRCGYVNRTVINNKATVGYSFYADGKTTDGCPQHVKQNIYRYFKEKYGCVESDIIPFEGKGSNTGKIYSMIASPSIALQVFRAKALFLGSL